MISPRYTGQENEIFTQFSRYLDKKVVVIVVVVILNRTEIGNFVSGNHVGEIEKKLFFYKNKIDEKRLRQVTTDLGLTITLDLT